MNKDTLTQSAIETERKALDAVINILLIFIFGLVAFSAGYYLAMSEASALVKTMLN
jgi:TRAP-type C4-dicarboxylate transport system permease small subunit